MTTGGLETLTLLIFLLVKWFATTHSTDYLTREVTVKLSADTHNVDVIGIREFIMRQLKRVGVFYCFLSLF